MGNPDTGKDLEVVNHLEEDPWGLSSSDREFLNNLTEREKKAAVRKVDWRLVPLLTVLYLFSYIDRTNIGNVKIEGIVEDLDLSGNRFNVATCLFFAPYCLLEIPSNWILSKVPRPSWYLGGLVVSWGLVMTFSGFVQSYSGLLAVRFMLGVTEAGFYPGALYLIGRWYMPNELQIRIACFYSASAAAGAFSGLLAYGIAKMDGISGYRGWRWIFIVEGIVSVLAGIVCLLCMPDDPDSSSRWLSNDEIRYLNCRVLSIPGRRATREKKHGFEWKILQDVFLDWQIYLIIVVYWANSMPNYALKFNMPKVIKNMGYTSANAQLLTIPPYAFGAITAFVSSWFADRYVWRMPFIVFGLTLVIISHVLLYCFGPTLKEDIALCYFALVLACIGFYPILPAANAWILSNLAGPTKRAMGIGWLVAIGNLGGVPGSFIYKEIEAPNYPTAYGASFSVAAAGIVACFMLELIYKRINKQRAQKSEAEYRQMYTSEELEEMGDRSPLFKYAL